jgi:beta-phosphoglucomutase-like phosphatase (HAD superfamily)
MLPGSGKALLFDIDGTLADTDALHLEAFNHVFGPRGHVFDRERAAKELMGFSTASIRERFLPDEPPERQAAIMAEKETVFRRLVAGKIQPVAGLMTLLARADRANIPMVAVTNAPRLNAEMLLSGLGIMHRFKAVVIGDELAHGKPHPMPYLEGLRAVNAARSVRGVRRLPFRHQVGVRRGYYDDRNTHEPQPCRHGRGRFTHDGQQLRRSGIDETGRGDDELVTRIQRGSGRPVLITALSAGN